MTSETTYNGWTNYPTWAVNLWLSNDEGLYRETLAITNRHLRAGIDHLIDADDAGDGLEQYAHAKGRLADQLRDWVRDDLAPDLGASFAADLLGYALDHVDWHEIAGAWMTDALEQVQNA